MNLNRTTAYCLLLLDIAMSILVFNIIGHYRGLPVAEHLLLVPLVPPIIALVLAVYLIEGYKALTDMLSVDYTSQHTIALLGAMLATLLFTFVVVTDGYELQSSRAVIAFSFLVLIPLTISYRRLIYLGSLRARGDALHFSKW